MNFGDKIFIDTPYRPESGSFCKPVNIKEGRYKAGHWYYCRDLFHAQLYNLDLFFFSHESNKGYCVGMFMKKIEEILEVVPSSQFGPTQKKNIMWIEPSRWWTSRAMKRSLFTILLRSGTQYIPSEDNFKEALFSDPYAMSTKQAIKRFMAGNTCYVGKRRGWYKQFYEDNPTAAQIKKLLIKP